MREVQLSGLTTRADALFELADAVLCADRPVSSLVGVPEPEFRRGHGALLPPLVDGPEARAWIAEHDVIGPLSLDELWRAYLARIDIEHAIRTLKGTLGLTAAKVRAPEQAGRWVRVVIAAQAQLLLARPLAAGLGRPWEKQPDPARPLSPGRVRRGFRNIRPEIGTPARVPKPARPGPGRPKGSGTGPATRHLFSQAKPACHALRTRH